MADLPAMSNFGEFLNHVGDLYEARIPVAAYALSIAPGDEIGFVTFMASGGTALKLADLLERHARDIRAATAGYGDMTKPGHA